MPPEAGRRVAPASPREMIPANLWQTLLVPRQFVTHFMLQITADLYSIYLVLFLHTNLEEDYIDYIPDFAARGDWNDRHCALRLNSKLTYEPMIPESMNPSRYRLPKPTFQRYPADMKNEGLSRLGDQYHPWLCDFLEKSAPEPLYHKSGVEDVDERDMVRVVWVTLDDT
jgi:hypothetical protein